MKCFKCGKEMKNTIGGNYSCDCGFSLNDLVNSQPQSCDIPMPQGWGQQGWVCPKCGNVLSPTSSYCFFCAPKQPIITYGTGTAQTSIDVDWTKHQTVTVSQEKKG